MASDTMNNPKKGLYPLLYSIWTIQYG